MNENELAKIVFEAGLKVHKVLGAGLLESAYEECLYYELCKLNLKIERQKRLHLVYPHKSGFRVKSGAKTSLCDYSTLKPLLLKYR
jgi:GxxExxY protein